MQYEEIGLRNKQNFITKGMRRIRQRMYVFRLGCHGRYQNCSVALPTFVLAVTHALFHHVT